jgi:hypothetical protein
MKLISKRKKDSIVLDSNEQKKIKPAPKLIRREAVLNVEKNRWFVIAIILSAVALMSAFSAYQANIRADQNIKVAWVKMYPSGTWDIEFHDEHRKPEFFQATIDYLISQWVERRYSQISHSIKNDYGYAYNFMSPKLRQEFIDPSQFNAPGKAAEIAGCSACNHIEFKVRTDIDHFDSDRTRFGQHEGVLYRSNVFVRRDTKNPDGNLVSTANMIVTLQWRIKSTAEIQADKKMLKQNPIGLEIIDYDLLDDPSQKTKGAIAQ